AFDLFFLYSLILLTSFPILPPPSPPSPLFPYTTLFRSIHVTLRASSGGELPSPGRAGQQLPHLPHEHPRIGEQAEGGDPQHRPPAQAHLVVPQGILHRVQPLLVLHPVDLHTDARRRTRRRPCPAP